MFSSLVLAELTKLDPFSPVLKYLDNVSRSRWTSVGSMSHSHASRPMEVTKDLWSDHSKKVGDQFIRIYLKIAKKCCSCLDIFSCVKMNVYLSFFFSFQARDSCQMQ